MTNHQNGDRRKLLARMLREKLTQEEARPESGREPNGDFEAFALPVTQLKSEILLDPAIRFDAPPVQVDVEPAAVLLTGATGFLGSFLLYQLLRQTRARIHCLLRCSGLEQGRKRIYGSLERYGLAGGYDASRVVPVQGDVSQPLFGLTAAAFERLSMGVDAVYHNAAVVNWVYNYAQLKPTNVLGAQEAIRLAACGKLKPLHYISTVAACPLEDAFDVTIVPEAPLASDTGVLYGGYPQSKWVAEQLTLRANAAGLPLRIYRPGIISGHSRTGACNVNDATSRMIKMAVDLGVAPDLDAAVDMTPIDYVSRAIVHLSSLNRAPGTIYHLANSGPVRSSDLVAWIRSFGYPMRLVPYEVWRSDMVGLAKRTRRNPLSTLTPLFSMVVSDKLPAWTGKTVAACFQNTMDRLIGEVAAMYGRKTVQLDCRVARRDLAGTSILCPAVDEQLLHTYLAFFVRVGFIGPPATASRAGVAKAW
jgi:thioester reductase-like protein